MDLEGKRRVARPETLTAVLRGLGAAIDRPADAAAALAERREAARRRVCEPAVVAWGGRLAVRLRLPAGRAGDPISGRLELEDGSHRDGLVLVRTRAHRDGDDAIITAAVSGPLPLGVHRLEITAGAVRGATHVIAAPRRCFEGDGSRALGIFAPLYALHSSPGASIGDLGDLGRLARWAGRAGCRYVGTLPLYACFLDEPFDPSPYSPVTRLFFNELFAHLDPAPAAAGADGGPLVDYRQAVRRQRPALDRLAEEAFASPAGRAEIESFLAADPQVDDYARFRAAAERRRRDWRGWEDPARRGELSPGDYDERDRRRHVYAQWLLHGQLADVGGGDAAALYLDLPVGVHPGGYDTWRRPEQFALPLSAGAPPDPFFSRGQNWGFPPPHPETPRLDGHRHLRDVLARSLRMTSLLRIDHVMGLHRMYCVPQGADAADGAYVTYPSAEQYAILCLESRRHRTRIAGENLGTVPRRVEQDMERRGLLRMWVGQFAFRPEAGPDGVLPPIEPGTLATLNTHDMTPFAGFWRGDDVELRRRHDLLDEDGADRERAARARLRAVVEESLRRRGLLDGEPAPGAVLRALLEHLARSGADVMIVNLEDLWLETEPHNAPGLPEPPPWRRRLARDLDSIERDDALAAHLSALAAMIGSP